MPGVLFLPDLGYDQRIWADLTAGLGPDPVADPGHTVVVAYTQLSASAHDRGCVHALTSTQTQPAAATHARQQATAGH